MPAGIPDTVDPYTSSQQWSRRFMGLKLFLSLAVAGREGYAGQLERDADLADALRRGLAEAGWDIVNDTPLPVVCFADPGTATREHHDALAEHVVRGGRAWISPVDLSGRAALRACVISHRTTPADVDDLVEAVGEARKAL
jgi:glutamate/tyrosine decarboxylase-like PLP-dependent enzyme